MDAEGLSIQQALQFTSVGSRVQIAWHHSSLAVTQVEMYTIGTVGDGDGEGGADALPVISSQHSIQLSAVTSALQTAVHHSSLAVRHVDR